MSGRPARRSRSYDRRAPPTSSRRDWGWHRLEAEWARRIVDASPVAAGELVLDIGAGTGALTRPLLEVGARVVAVELNEHRAAVLRQRFGDEITVVRTDLRRLRLPSRPFRVVASPPYGACSDLIALLLTGDRLLSADLVLQRGAAGRLVASPPGRRHTSQYTFALGMQVPRRAFVPRPRVDSVVMQVRRR